MYTLLQRDKILNIFFSFFSQAHKFYHSLFSQALVPRFRMNGAIPPPPSLHLHGVDEGKTSLSTLPIKSTISQQQQRTKTCRPKVHYFNKYCCWNVWLRWKRICRLQTQRFLIRHSVGGSLQSATISIRTIYEWRESSCDDDTTCTDICWRLQQLLCTEARNGSSLT